MFKVKNIDTRTTPITKSIIEALEKGVKINQS